MEILNSTAKKRTILVVSDGKQDMTKIVTILEKKYYVIYLDNPDRDYARIRKQTNAISAAIVSATEAAENEYALFDWMRRHSDTAAIPILVYCGGEQEIVVAEQCLERGAVDMIMAPFYEKIIYHRIENAIRLKDSATFYEIEHMLKDLPSNIYLKDSEGKYVFATHYWHHLEHPDDPDWTIRGKTDIEIRKDRDNAKKAMESDMEILRTGQGTSYVIEIKEDGMREFYELIKEPVRDHEGNITGIIGLINDVTDMQLLRIQLEEKATHDELTGADNRNCFEQFASGLQSSSKFPVSIISADCNSLKYINDNYGHLVGDEYIRMSVMLFRMVLPERAHIFRTGGDEFIMILPATEEEQAKEYVQKMKEESRQFKIKDRKLSIAYGVASLTESHSDMRECLELADRNMYEDKRVQKSKEKEKYRYDAKMIQL